MGFIEAYKHLEKLCGEVLNDNRCISAYIDEMLNTSRGSYFISGWDDDLKKLKHYRWIRNQIVHEPNCTEQNMCEPKDEVWLENFYSRIMQQKDPLALYFKATQNHQAVKPTQIHKIEPSRPDAYHQPSNPKETIAFFLGVILIVAFVALALRLF